MKKKEILLVIVFLLLAGILFALNAVLPKQNGRERIEALMTTQEPAVQAELMPRASAPPEENKAEDDASADTPVKPDNNDAEINESTKSDASSSAPETVGPSGPALAKPQSKIRGYVLITINGRQYGDPIPMDRDKIITVRQSDEMINRIHITPDSVEMESSTCENQDCVGEGIITLENYKTRILSTYIICLPNGVQVEMIPVDGE